jgi:hypothetical protein
LLLARESYVTALMGLWVLGSLLGRRPFIFTATMRLTPESGAAQWRRDWDSSAQFRRAMRVITVLWGGSFLIDAVARVVMAYTLPVDVVPALSVALIVTMLTLVVWFEQGVRPPSDAPRAAAYAGLSRRRTTGARGGPLVVGAVSPSGVDHAACRAEDSSCRSSV